MDPHNFAQGPSFSVHETAGLFRHIDSVFRSPYHSQPVSPTRLLHSSYDLTSKSPDLSYQFQNTCSDFRDVVNRGEASLEQTDALITFVDNDQIMGLARPIFPELRTCPVDNDYDNASMDRIVHSLAHRVPAHPGDDPQLDAAEIAYREEYKEELAQMQAQQNEMARRARGMSKYMATADAFAATPVPNLGTCGWKDCGSPSTQRCAKCKAVYYCGSECQRKAWKTHKRLCVVPGMIPLPRGMRFVYGEPTTLEAGRKAREGGTGQTM